MHTHLYCKTLRRVPKRDLINSVHEMLLQLRANGTRAEIEGRTLDNKPAIDRASRLLRQAGHPGF